MTDRELLEAMSSQIGELVHHVAEVRQSNKRLEGRFDKLEGRFDNLESRFDKLEDRFDKLEDRLDKLEARIKGIELRLESVETRVERLESNVSSLRQEVASIRDDVHALDAKIDEKTNFLSGKIDHFIGHVSKEQTRDRNKFEEERYLRSALQQKTEQRLSEIEQRLGQLEAASADE